MQKVYKSTAECKGYNAANEAAIGSGLMEALEPDDSMKEQEKRAARAAALMFDGKFVHDCYIRSTHGVYTPAKVVREGKATITVATASGREQVFTGTRANPKRLEERGGSRYYIDHLELDVAECDKRIAERDAIKARQARITTALKTIELATDRSTRHEWTLDEAKVLALEACAAALAPAPAAAAGNEVVK